MTLKICELINIVLSALVGGMYWGPWLALDSNDRIPRSASERGRYFYFVSERDGGFDCALFADRNAASISSMACGSFSGWWTRSRK